MTGDFTARRPRQEGGGVPYAQDHYVWVTPDLAAGVEQLARLLGLEPIAGGVHAGLGTANAIVPLGDRAYLEIIGPHTGLQASSSFGSRLRHLGVQGLYHWAARSNDLSDVISRAESAGLPHSGILEQSRLTPEGRKLTWKMLLPRHPQFGFAVPFFIDWGNCDHPTTGRRAAATVRSFRIVTDTPELLASLLSGLNVPVEIERGSPSRLVLEIQAPTGRVQLCSPVFHSDGIQL